MGYQQGTLDASRGIHRWMGSIAMDHAGNIALGYSASSASVFPSIRYTGRMVSDAQGTMDAESVIWQGTGSQLRNLDRWGDIVPWRLIPWMIAHSGTRTNT
jgi:hypothetical protein